jgi:hypothetical protein
MLLSVPLAFALTELPPVGPDEAEKAGLFLPLPCSACQQVTWSLRSSQHGVTDTLRGPNHIDLWCPRIDFNIKPAFLTKEPVSLFKCFHTTFCLPLEHTSKDPASFARPVQVSPFPF